MMLISQMSSKKQRMICFSGKFAIEKQIFQLYGDNTMVFWATSFLIIALDIISKLLASANLRYAPPVQLWQGVFQLSYVENKGAAFGIFQNGRWFFVGITIIVLAVVFITAKKYKGRSNVLKLSLAFLTGGAVGNLIDRIFRGYVVDFFDFCLIDFPVFNVADIFVCVGACLMIICILVLDESKPGKKDEDNAD
jgi:signal peptidase II